MVLHTLRAIQAALDQLQQKFDFWSSQFKICNTAAPEFQKLHKGRWGTCRRNLELLVYLEKPVYNARANLTQIAQPYNNSL